MNSQKRVCKGFVFCEDICEKSVSAQSTTTLTQQCLRGTRPLFENFEGFSQIVKEQSGRKKLFGCVYTSNSNNFKILKLPYLKKNSWKKKQLQNISWHWIQFKLKLYKTWTKIKRRFFREKNFFLQNSWKSLLFVMKQICALSVKYIQIFGWTISLCLQ